jgi:hypothetical protein
MHYEIESRYKKYLTPLSNHDGLDDVLVGLSSTGELSIIEDTSRCSSVGNGQLDIDESIQDGFISMSMTDLPHTGSIMQQPASPENASAGNSYSARKECGSFSCETDFVPLRL